MTKPVLITLFNEDDIKEIYNDVICYGITNYNQSSPEIQEIFKEKYQYACSLIAERQISDYLLEKTTLEELKKSMPAVVIVSMVGKKIDYHELFEYLKKECPEISVITISTREESEEYEAFYESEQLRNIKGILEEKYSVAVAPSGFHEFVSVGKKMPDLILLDYEMPEMNGKEVMEKLQSDEELREIPIVFLTSADSKEIVMELLALKPAGYILKPVESQMLLERIEEIIGK